MGSTRIPMPCGPEMGRVGLVEFCALIACAPANIRVANVAKGFWRRADALPAGTARRRMVNGPKREVNPILTRVDVTSLLSAEKRPTDINGTVSGILRDYASIQRSTQSRWGYKGAAAAV